MAPKHQANGLEVVNQSNNGMKSIRWEVCKVEWGEKIKIMREDSSSESSKYEATHLR